jgi:glycosyltransferase involved in cell wall biosynthesis
MKIAFVVSNLTYPPEEGLHQQTLLTAQMHLDHGEQVHLMGFCRDMRKLDLQRMQEETGLSFYLPPIPSNLPDVVLGLVNRFVPGFMRGRAVRELKREILSGYDVIHFENIAACGLVRPHLANRSVIGLIDPGTLRWRRMFKAYRGFKLKAKSLLAVCLHNLLEGAVALPGTRVHVVSHEDAKYLKERRKDTHVQSIPVVVPMSQETTDAGAPEGRRDSERPTGMVFMDLRQPHLRSSFLWFIQSVYRPMFAENQPFDENYPFDLVVLGRTSGDPELEKACLGLPVRFLSWVEDLHAAFADSDFVIVPDLVGTGIKNRVIQAMAARRPVVGTPIAFEGIPVLNGIHALVVDTAEAMSRVLVEICEQPELRELMGRNARKLVVKEFGRESLQQYWHDLYRLKVAKKPEKVKYPVMIC